LHKDQPMLQLPYYWSGYTYSGHLQKVDLPKKKAYWLYCLSVMSLMLVLMKILFYRPWKLWLASLRGYSL
jgi:hypothetical protein